MQRYRSPIASERSKKNPEDYKAKELSRVVKYYVPAAELSEKLKARNESTTYAAESPQSPKKAGN